MHGRPDAPILIRGKAQPSRGHRIDIPARRMDVVRCRKAAKSSSGSPIIVVEQTIEPHPRVVAPHLGGEGVDGSPGRRDGAHDLFAAALLGERAPHGLDLPFGPADPRTPNMSPSGWVVQGCQIRLCQVLVKVGAVGASLNRLIRGRFHRS